MFKRLSPFVFCLSAVACSANATDDVVGASEDVGESESEIINGVVQTADNSGFVRFTGSRGCSGTLVRNDWVLTANSCGAYAGMPVTMGSQSRTVDRVIRHPGASGGVDLALLHTAPFVMNGATNQHIRWIRPSLVPVGEQVQCFGYGRGTTTSLPGTLRSAWLRVASASGNLYRWNQALTQNRRLSDGDQGGTCLDAGGALTTVVSRVVDTGTAPFGEGVTSQMFAPWVEGVLAGGWYQNVVSGPTAASDIFAFGSGADLVSIYRGTNNHIYERRDSTSASFDIDVTAQSTGPLAAGKPFGWRGLDGIEDIVYRGADNRIYENSRRTDGVFGWGDLLAGTAAPLAASDPTAVVFTDGSHHVFYRGTDAHIHELTWSGPGRVAHYDLSRLLNARGATGSPTAVMYGGELHVFYVATNRHVYDIYWSANAWHYWNLTYATSAPEAYGQIAAYSSPDTIGVVYRGANNHIYRFATVASSGWTNESLTFGIAGAPLAQGDPSAYYSPADQRHHVLFRTADSHVWDFGGWSTTAWRATDLTAASGAAPHVEGTPSGAARPSDGLDGIFYRSWGGVVNELRRR